MIRQFFGRLYVRMMLVALLMFGGLSGLGLYLISQHERDSAILTTASRIGNLSARIAPLLANSNATSVAASESRILELLLSERAVLCAELRPVHEPGRLLAITPLLVGCKNQPREHAITISIDSEPPRILSIFYSQEIAAEENNAQHALMLAVLAAALLLTFLVTSIAYGLRIGRPLNQLHQTVLRRTGQPLAFDETGASRHSRDELEDLSLAFTTMIERDEKRERVLRDEKAKLAELNTMLEERVQARTKELVNALADVHASSEAKSRFVATMSHEVRTPLNAVIGMSSLLAEHPLDDVSRQYVQAIHQASDQLLAIVNDILDFSKLESSTAQIALRDFDLRQLVSEVVQIGRALADANHLKMLTRIDPGLPDRIHSDPLRVRQVLLNLIGNAAKFTHSGSITLSLERCDEPTGKIGSNQASIRFCVMDTGPGIPPHLQAKIFDPFEQGSSGIATPMKGSGLGLAICRRIAAMLDGSLSLESVVDQGSSFSLTIPLIEASPESNATTVAPGPALVDPDTAIRSPLRILVAEDTPANQMVIRLILERLGHTVSVVNDGAQAVAAFLDQEFDLIMLDVQMPVMDGYQAAHELRERMQTGRQIPIVGLSAFAQLQDRQRAFDAGMTHYLSKPVRIEDVIRLMAELSERASASDD